MNRLIEMILKRPALTVMVIVALSIPMIYFYATQSFFNHIDVFFNADDPDLVEYKRFQEKYGNEEIVVIAFEDQDIFTAENIALVRSLSEATKKNMGIQRVISLTEAEEAVGVDDTVAFRKIIPPDLSDPAELAQLKQRILSDRILVNNIISPDGKATLVVMELEVFHDNNEKREVILEIKKRALELAGDRITLHFSGAPYVEGELNRLSLQDTVIFTPAVLFMVFMVVLFFLRKILMSVLCLVILGLTAIWTVGIFTMMGERMNMVTVVIPPLLLAMAVSDAIHILSHFRDTRLSGTMDYRESLIHTLRLLWYPCFLTAASNAAGFFSFGTTDLRPVEVMGIYSCIGVLIAYLMTMFFIPAFLILFPRWFDFNKDDIERSGRRKIRKDYFAIALSAIGRFTISRYRIIMVVTVVLLAIAGFGMTLLNFETNFGNYLPSNSPLRKDADFIAQRIGGIVPIEFLIRAKDQTHDFTNPESLKLIDEIQHELPLKVDTFTTSYSVTDYLKEVHRAFNEGKQEFYRVPESRDDIVFYTESGDPAILDRFLSPNRMETRISFRARWVSNEHAETSTKIIDEYFDNKLNHTYTATSTGLALLYVRMGNNLKYSQIVSFFTAFITIFGMMYFACRNVLLTVICLIPNVFPIFLILGIMGFFNIPLDVATIMIASITLGIAVDDTTHYVTWYRRNIVAGMETKDALLKTYADAGKPMVITSLVLIVGFSILILGAIKPTQSFGILTAVAMIFAMASDLFMTPMLILTAGKWLKIKR